LVKQAGAADRSDVAAAADAAPLAVIWPEPEALLSVARDCAHRVCAREGIAMPGFPQALALLTLPYLEVAARVGFGTEEAAILAAEVEGRLAADLVDRGWIVAFRADRMDRSGEVQTLLDYKTGKSRFTSAASTRGRQKALMKRIRTGELLQAAAYALALPGDADRGGYFWLTPDFPPGDELRIDLLEKSPQLAAALAPAVATLLEAAERGHFLPRLSDPARDQELPCCRTCDVAAACPKAESGDKIRLREWMRSEPESGSERAPETASLRRLWWLPKAEQEGGQP
jgi:hypothetical protein